MIKTKLIKLKRPKRTVGKVAVFLLRVDSVTGKGEGEIYRPSEKGVINCECWSSPKLTDHQAIIATGDKEIDSVYQQYDTYHITEK